MHGRIALLLQECLRYREKREKERGKREYVYVCISVCICVCVILSRSINKAKALDMIFMYICFGTPSINVVQTAFEFSVQTKNYNKITPRFSCFLMVE